MLNSLSCPRGRTYKIACDYKSAVNYSKHDTCLGTPGGPPDSANCRKAPVCIHKQYSGNYNLGTFYVSHTPEVHQPLCQPRTRHPQIAHLYSQHRDPRQEVHTATILLMSHGSHSRVYRAHFSLLTQDPMFHYIVTSSCLLFSLVM